MKCIRVFFFVAVLATFTITSYLGCSEDEWEDLGLDEDTDTTSAEDSEFACEKDRVFDYAPQTVSVYEENESGELTLHSRYTYNYGPDKRLTTMFAEIFADDGTPDYSYQRQYSYDALGRVAGSEWTAEDIPFRISYEYNSEGLLSKRLWEFEDGGVWARVEQRDYEYDASGRLRRFLIFEGTEEADYWGADCAFDENGRAAKLTFLASEDGVWSDDGNYTEFSYDALGRITSFYYVSYSEDSAEVRTSEKVCRYDGDSGRIIQCVLTGEDYVETEKFTWQDTLMTLTTTLEFDGEDPTHEKREVRFTAQGDSFFYQAVPTPASTWVKGVYGNGKLHGCHPK